MSRPLGFLDCVVGFNFTPLHQSAKAAGQADHVSHQPKSYSSETRVDTSFPNRQAALRAGIISVVELDVDMQNNQKVKKMVPFLSSS